MSSFRIIYVVTSYSDATVNWISIKNNDYNQRVRLNPWNQTILQHDNVTIKLPAVGASQWSYNNLSKRHDVPPTPFAALMYTKEPILLWDQSLHWSFAVNRFRRKTRRISDNKERKLSHGRKYELDVNEWTSQNWGTTYLVTATLMKKFMNWATTPNRF